MLSRTSREADGKECACSDGCTDNWETFWWRMQAERMMGCVWAGFWALAGLEYKLGSPAVGGVLGESQRAVAGKRNPRARSVVRRGRGAGSRAAAGTRHAVRDGRQARDEDGVRRRRVCCTWG